MDKYCTKCGSELVNGVCPNCAPTVPPQPQSLSAQPQGFQAQPPQSYQQPPQSYQQPPQSYQQPLPKPVRVKRPLNFDRVEATRIAVKSVGVVLAIFALIGSISMLVYIGRLSKIDRLSETAAMKLINSFFASLDFARIGAAVIFGATLLLSLLNRLTSDPEPGISLFSKVTSGIGFLGVFICSPTLLTVLSIASAETRSEAPGTVMKVFMIISMILILLAAIAMITTLGSSIFRAAMMRMPVYPQQGYPQQGYPQQGYPQQGYTQQSYPQQNNDDNEMN